MKKIILKLTLVLFIILIILNIDLIKAKETYIAVLFIKKIFPSLFFIGVICSIIKKTSKLNIYEIYLLSIISGSPNNALILGNSKNTLLTMFINPVFLYTMLSSFLNTKNIIIILSTYYVIATIYFLKNKENIIINNKDEKNIISNSIKEVILNMLSIFGTISNYYLVLSLIDLYIPSFLTNYIAGIFEITTGLIKASNINDLFILNVLIEFFISFTSFSIISQVSSIANIDIKVIIKYRFKFALITSFIVLVFTLIT